MRSYFGLFKLSIVKFMKYWGVNCFCLNLAWSKIQQGLVLWFKLWWRGRLIRHSCFFGLFSILIYRFCQEVPLDYFFGDHWWKRITIGMLASALGTFTSAQAEISIAKLFLCELLTSAPVLLSANLWQVLVCIVDNATSFIFFFFFLVT